MSTAQQNGEDKQQDGQSPKTYNEIAAEHIRQLAEYNELTPTLLRHAAQSISLLTNTPIQSDSSNSTSITTPAQRVALIRETSTTIFMLTNTLRTALHKQVDDLQSQSVIPAEASRYIPAPTMPQAGPEQQEAARKKEEGRITNGGLGKLDIAELNARAGVGREGDEEVLKRLVGIVEVLREKMGEQAEGEEKEGELAVDG